MEGHLRKSSPYFQRPADDHWYSYHHSRLLTFAYRGCVSLAAHRLLGMDVVNGSSYHADRPAELL